MKITALLTGRGNNTLEDKNILNILGHPVLYYPAHAARMSKKIDSYYCSSDDERILLAAKNEGYESIVRPKELATPTAQHIEAIWHGIEEICKKEKMPDILIVILANNITIKSSWIDECISLMEADMSISAVVPVYNDNDHHPLRGKKVINGRLQMYEQNIKEKISTNRQDLPACYFLAHNFWVLNTHILLEKGNEGQQPWGFMGDNIAYIEKEESIDIHKEIDLLIAEEWIKKNYNEDSGNNAKYSGGGYKAY